MRSDTFEFGHARCSLTFSGDGGIESHGSINRATGYSFRDWLEFQLRASEQPGCMVAIAHRGKMVAEYAFGHANLADPRKQLTPRHRFRIASQFEEFHRRRNHEAARAAPAGAVTEVWLAGAEIRAAPRALADFLHFISASASARNAWRERVAGIEHVPARIDDELHPLAANA